MNLHDIQFGPPTRYAWASVYGGNGQRLGRSAHLYEATRGTPPPLATTWGPGQRIYWTPWRITQTNIEAILTPVCGRLNTRSRQPYLQAPSGRWPTDTCTACETTQPTGTYLRIINENDPWYAIDRLARATTRDPISGL